MNLLIYDVLRYSFLHFVISVYNLTDQQLKAYLVLTAGTNMSSIDVHLYGTEIDNIILKYSGLAAGGQMKKIY